VQKEEALRAKCKLGGGEKERKMLCMLVKKGISRSTEEGRKLCMIKKVRW
jgi:hypothetical protein